MLSHCKSKSFFPLFDLFNEVGGLGFQRGLGGEVSESLIVGIQDLQVNLVLIRLVDICFSGVFSDPHCGYTQLEGGSCFNHISGHDFQKGVLRSSL